MDRNATRTVCFEPGSTPALPDRQTRLHGKRVTRVKFQSQLRKKCRSLLEINCSQGETALCCAVLALSGTDTLVSLIPRPVPGHQWLDDRRSPLGASQHKKKKKKKKKKATWTRRKLETKVHCSNRPANSYARTALIESLPKKNQLPSA